MALIQQTTLDSQDTIFFQRELETIDQKVFEVKYPTRKFAEGIIIPITQNADPLDKKYTYRMWDRTGLAKIINNYGKDLPRVSVKGKEHSITGRHVGSSFGYTEDEIKRARKYNKPLDSMLAMACRAAISEKLEQIARNGDAEYDLKGFKQILDNYVPELVLLADGTGSYKLFSTKNFEQIVRDVLSVITAVVENTDEIEAPNTLLLPLTTYTLLQRKFNTNTDKSAMDLIVESNVYIKRENIIPLTWLETAGAGGTRRMVAYERNPDKISFEIPVSLERQAPQLKNYEWINNLRARTFGVFSRYPLSLVYADGF